MNYQPWSTDRRKLSTIPVDSTLNCDALEITGKCEWEYSYIDDSHNTYGYGPSTNMTDKNLVGTSVNYDWGVYNAVSNGGNKAGMWRTLTSREWDYLLNNRTNAQYLWSIGYVNEVRGLIILPDNFSKPASISWTPKAYGTTNTYTTEEWETLQAVGAVFLPAAGQRPNKRGTKTNGYYWSSTVYSESDAYLLYFTNSDAQLSNYNRCYRLSVRLVQDVK